MTLTAHLTHAERRPDASTRRKAYNLDGGTIYVRDTGVFLDTGQEIVVDDGGLMWAADEDGLFTRVQDSESLL